jgi:hypothetical protein
MKVMILVALLCCSQGLAQSDVSEGRKPWMVPDYIRTQYAGNIGLISVGVGFNVFDDNLQVDLLYGYVPTSVANLDVHNITVKTNTVLYNARISSDCTISPLLIGFSLSLALGDSYFVSVPGRYPANYYWPTALRLGLYIGSKIHRTLDNTFGLSGIDFYFEAGTVDIYLRNYLQSDHIDLWDIVSFGAGTSIHF